MQKTTSDSRAEVDFEPVQQTNYVVVKIRKREIRTINRRTSSYGM
jgi:hypothetical protein